MGTDIIRNIVRFVVLVLLQALVLKQISPDAGFFYYVSFLIYPLFIILLPFRYSTTTILLLSFLLGISIDLFYDSPGVHASASVFAGFVRPLVLSVFEPRGGYNLNQIPSKHFLGINWFVRYAGTLLFLHLLFYFSVEAFTFVYIGQILLKTLSSFFLSMIFIVAYVFIFDPQE